MRARIDVSPPLTDKALAMRKKSLAHRTFRRWMIVQDRTLFGIEERRMRNGLVKRMRQIDKTTTSQTIDDGA